jgi:hypothetical protein
MPFSRYGEMVRNGQSAVGEINCSSLMSGGNESQALLSMPVAILCFARLAILHFAPQHFMMLDRSDFLRGGADRFQTQFA